MNTKKITTLILLLFVVVSVGTIIAKEKGPQEPTVASAPEMALPSTTEAPYTPIPQQTASAVAPVAPSEKATPVKVVAYYFHGNMRCYSCKLIESFTVEAIESGFADDIKSGRVELKIVNVEEPANEHYIQDFELASRSVVVARYEGGQQKDWKRLDEVWQLVRDRDAFIRFVQEQTTNLLKGHES